MPHTAQQSRSGRFAGMTLIAANLLAAFAILHHPTSHGDTPMHRVEDFARIESLNSLVHGGMIAMLLFTWLALGELSAQRGANLARIRNAGQLCAIGAGSMIGAALINGFISPSLAQIARDQGAGAVEAATSLLHLCWASNQTLAGFGLLLLSVGIATWSSNLLSGPSRFARIAGAYGLLIALGCSAAFLFGALQLDVTGMIIVVFAQAIWYILIGIGLLRGLFAPAATPA